MMISAEAFDRYENEQVDRHKAKDARIAALESALKVAEEALAYTAEWLWDPDENALSQFERIGDMYYRETHRLRPGKDDPFTDTNSGENWKRFQEWCAEQNRKRHHSLSAALAAIKEARHD